MVEIKGLTKTFGTQNAVDNISFTVGKGEILGFAGNRRQTDIDRGFDRDDI